MHLKSYPYPTTLHISLWNNQQLSALPSSMLVKGVYDPTTTILLLSSLSQMIKPFPLSPSSLDINLTTQTTNTNSSSSTYYQQHQCQIASENSLYSLSAGSDCHQSFDHNVGRAAAETILVIRLSLKLLRYLGYNLLISLIWLFLVSHHYFVLLWDWLLSRIQFCDVFCISSVVVPNNCSGDHGWKKHYSTSFFFFLPPAPQKKYIYCTSWRICRLLALVLAVIASKANKK